MIPSVYRYWGEEEPKRNLVLTMSGAASSRAMRLEDQLTEALAWLLDHDSAFALRFTRRFAAGDERALGELDKVDHLCVATQIRLDALEPTIGDKGPDLRPDLSLTAPDRRFQLLLEVKLGADFRWEEYRTPLAAACDQVTADVTWWDARAQAEPDREAEVRLVGTLTVCGRVPPHGEGRAADLRWKDVAELLAGTVERVAVVADDLCVFIDKRLYVQVYAPPPFLEAGATLASRVTDHLASRVNHRSSRKGSGEGHAGVHLHFTTPWGDSETLWIVVTARGSLWAPWDSDGSALWLYFPDNDREKPATRTALTGSDFQDIRVRYGPEQFGICLMDDLDDELLSEHLDLDEVAWKAGERALGWLSEARLTIM